MAERADSTNVSLLERLCRSGARDQAAWADFVERYGRRIYRWCRGWKLQHADAEDVTQVVLTKLALRMKDFVYEPGRSFRAWLKTVTHHAWQDFVTSRQFRDRGTGDDDVLDQLRKIAAPDDLVGQFENEFDLELMERATILVRLRVAPHNWEAYRLTAIDGVPVVDAARRLEMKIARVYAARKSVQEKLKEECRRLDPGQEMGLPEAEL